MPPSFAYCLLAVPAPDDGVGWRDSQESGLARGWFDSGRGVSERRQASRGRNMRVMETAFD